MYGRVIQLLSVYRMNEYGWFNCTDRISQSVRNKGNRIERNWPIFASEAFFHFMARNGWRDDDDVGSKRRKKENRKTLSIPFSFFSVPKTLLFSTFAIFFAVAVKLSSFLQTNLDLLKLAHTLFPYSVIVPVVQLLG